MGMRSFLAGLGAGTVMAWIFDPQAGRRRRAMLRDRTVRSVHRLEETVDKGVRDLSHRAQGRLAEVRGRLAPPAGDDDVIVERVRAELGRWVSHPHAIEVTCQDGLVTLSGPILAAEVGPLARQLRRVRGVREVDNRLEPHATTNGLMALQGGQRRVGRRPEILQENWAPSVRLLGGLGGLALLVQAVRRGGLRRLPAAFAGGLLLGRSVCNAPIGVTRSS
jgi:hypothetical protein